MTHRLAPLAPLACLVAGAPQEAFPQAIIRAFARQGIRINAAEAEGIRPNVDLALREAAARGSGNSKVDFAAVEIAEMLGLDLSPGGGTVRRIVAALESMGMVLPEPRPRPAPMPRPLPRPVPAPSWNDYFNDTVNLWNRSDFLSLLKAQAFHPVKISWEDIGRDAGSVWGDRISDVGIWVRREEGDPSSAQLALSVRRDSNFRDKVLMVPAERIKVHVKGFFGRTEERTLPERLRELGLASRTRDRNVIVSNQFAIVPVPARDMARSGRGAPRAAFTFSIYPYGSTNYVITDVIEGSSEAIVGPGTHQLLYANIKGRKAPFTASRAEDRPDLQRLEQDLKARGMDVDVQRYYLIQVPLRREARARASNLGTPPLHQAYGAYPCAPACEAGIAGSVMGGAALQSAPAGAADQCQRSRSEGLSKVAIGHGDSEGAYFGGAGYQGQRAEEPIRVTVVYFVTPVGRITPSDMRTFANAFSQWDGQAIWGGSFVTKETF